MTVDWKKKLLPNLPYLLFVYLFDKLCQAVRLAPGLDASEKFLHLSQGFTEAFSSGLPSLYPLDLLVGIAGAVVVRLVVYAKSKNTKKYRKGIEYGSARWGTAADIAPYVDPVPDWNIPLTQTEKLTMSSRPKNPKYARNKNILVIGGSGAAQHGVDHARSAGFTQCLRQLDRFIHGGGQRHIHVPRLGQPRPQHSAYRRVQLGDRLFRELI